MLASPPCSSSSVAKKITSRFSRAFARFSATITARFVASIALLSIAPRPYKYPSLIVAAKGSTVHFGLSTPTTSMCATSNSAFDGSATAELLSRATTDVRPGATGNSSAAIPSFASTPKMYFAVSASFPGGFVVLILIRSCSQTFASPESFVRSPSGGPPCVPGNPFVAGGATCARAETAPNSAASPIAAIAADTFAKTPPPIRLTNSSSLSCSAQKRLEQFVVCSAAWHVLTLPPFATFSSVSDSY